MGQTLSYICCSICGAAALDEEERLYEQKLLIPSQGSRVHDETNANAASYAAQQKPPINASPEPCEMSAPNRAFILPTSPPCSVTDSDSTASSLSNQSFIIPPPSSGHCLDLSSKTDVAPGRFGTLGDSNNYDAAFDRISSIRVVDSAKDESKSPLESKQRIGQQWRKKAEPRKEEEEEKLRKQVVGESELIKQGPKEEEVDKCSFREYSDSVFELIASVNVVNFVEDETRVLPNPQAWKQKLRQLTNQPRKEVAEEREAPEEKKQKKRRQQNARRKKKGDKLKKQLAEEEKWIKHYSSHQMILLVGEGDFSFSASLAVAFGSAFNMVATSLDSEEFLTKHYMKASENIKNLRDRGCEVMHGIDATKMASHNFFKGKLFDRIVFNFPHAGFSKRNEPQDIQISQHQELVRLFLENAGKMIGPEGEIHISHKTNGFYGRWNLDQLASGVGLGLIEKVWFNLGDYPGYNTKYGFGGDVNFNCTPSMTYKFGVATGTVSKAQGPIKHDIMPLEFIFSV